ncbi:MAG: multidrug ABC transporter [Acidobacteriota bacterium]|nr:multidrug ABC transporter [Acidobacteriota bacterium]
MRTFAYASLCLLGGFISAISQVLLKKSAQRHHDSVVAEYLNVRVIMAYLMFFAATLLSVFAYRGIPLSMGPILDAMSYLYVTFFGVTIFHERVGTRKKVALSLILAGIVIYSFGI